MKQFKKVLAFVLALAMVVTAVPTADAKAAAKAPKLNNTKKILYVGQSYTLKIGNLPANWKKCTYAWSASNKNVTVKKGKYGQAASVKANKAGTATVTVKMTYPQTAAQKKAKKKTVKTFKCAVTVKTPSVKFVTTQAEVEVGTTAQFKATAVPSNATITYASSDKAVATVDANGVVTGVADGEAVISASIKTGTKTTTAKTTVKVFTAASTIKQIGAKKVEITLGKAATAETAVTVKKGAVTVSLVSENGKVLSADGKTLVLTTNSNITADKYTVVVGEETLEFTGEASKVTTIEIPSDKAVLSATSAINSGTGVIDTGATATASYVVKNQFGEDVTKTSVITTSDNTNIEASNGTITFKLAAVVGKKPNDLVAAVLINQETGVTASKTFTISSKAAIAEVEIKGVYNKDGKTLSEDINLSSDDFYLLVAAKDQYGNAVTKAVDTELVVSVGGLTEATVVATGNKVTKDGVDYIGLKITDGGTTAPANQVKAGTASVIIIPAASGKTATGSFTVADGAKVDTFDITIPDLVVGGEPTEFAFTATDTYGKEITDASVLSKMNMSGAPGFAFEKGKDGKAVLKYNGDSSISAPSDTLKSALFITNTNKVVNKTFTVKKDAEATAIVGIKNDVALGALKVDGNTVKIPHDKIIVEDQYGRTDKAAVGAISATTTAATADDKVFNGSNSITSVTSGNDLTFTLGADDTLKAGTEQFTLNLDADTKKVGTYTVTLTSVDQKDIKSYEVDDIAALYTENGNTATTGNYVKSVNVKGVLANGVKVVIPNDKGLYSVVTSDKLKYTDAANTLIANEKSDDWTKPGQPLEKVNEFTEKVTVIINATAEELVKEVKVSKEAPKAVSAKLDGLDEIKLSAGTELALSALAALTDAGKDTTGVIKVTDQYGVEDVFATTGTGTGARLSITDLSSDKITVANNGTDLAATTMAQAGDYTATAKITFASGYAFTFKVVLKKTA